MNYWIKTIVLFFQGGIRIQLKGEQLQRCLNILCRNGVELRELCYIDCNQLTATMNPKDLFRVKQAFRKSHTRLSILGKTGLPFLVRRYRNKGLLLVGSLLMLGMLQCAGQNIWTMEYVGNKQISSDSIEEFLWAQGIYPGACCKEFQREKLQKELSRAFPNVIWNSVSLHNSKVTVRLKEEKIKKEEGFNKDTDGNCYSSEDAMITSVFVRNGVSVVQVGDQVSKGDLLIQGRQDVVDESEQWKGEYLVQADGDIYGRVVHRIEQAVPKSVTRHQYDLSKGHLRGVALVAGNKRYECRLQRIQELDELHSIHSFRFFGKVYELELINGIPFQNVNEKYTKEQAFDIAKKTRKAYWETLPNGTQLIEENQEISEDDAQYVVSFTLNVIELLTEKGIP